MLSAAVSPRRVVLIDTDRRIVARLQACLHRIQTKPLACDIVRWPFDPQEVARGCASSPVEGIIFSITPAHAGWKEDLASIVSAIPNIPVLAFIPDNTEAHGEEALIRGAADYLLGHDLTPAMLDRTLASFSQFQAMMRRVHSADRRASHLLDSIGDAVVVTDSSGVITYLNPTAREMTGFGDEDSIGRPFGEVLKILDGSDTGQLRNPVADAIAHNKIVKLPNGCDLVKRDGQRVGIQDTAAPITDVNGNVEGAIMVFHDVTESRELARQVAHMATHDHLTGLPGRSLLHDRLNQALSAASREKRSLALLFVDVDHFKSVNDQFGHAVGDALLRLLGARMRSCVRTSDTVTRNGGDEFVVLLPTLTTARDAAVIAQKILTSVRAPFRIESRDIHASVSIGISVFPDDGATSEALLKHADIAMLSAKDSGKNQCEFYSASMKDAATVYDIEAELQKAIDEPLFSVLYQPQYRIPSQTLVGSEVLIRWTHPRFGVLTPDKFIPAAEHSRQIIPIGRWLLEQVCRQWKQWQAARPSNLHIALNVSAVELCAPGYAHNLRRVLQMFDVDARQIELELTETALISYPDSAIEVLKDLKAIGVRIALDDFGTGFSSLTHLKDFPIDVLKIDRSFVDGLGRTSKDASIVAAVIRMAASFDLDVVAEGIERKEQMSALVELGCSIGQGYYFGIPQSADEFAEHHLGQRWTNEVVSGTFT